MATSEDSRITNRRIDVSLAAFSVVLNHWESSNNTRQRIFVLLSSALAILLQRWRTDSRRVRWSKIFVNVPPACSDRTGHRHFVALRRILHDEGHPVNRQISVLHWASFLSNDSSSDSLQCRRLITRPKTIPSMSSQASTCRKVCRSWASQHPWAGALLKVTMIATISLKAGLSLRALMIALAQRQKSIAEIEFSWPPSNDRKCPSNNFSQGELVTYD